MRNRDDLRNIEDVLDGAEGSDAPPAPEPRPAPDSGEAWAGHTPGPWAWENHGGRWILIARHGMGPFVLDGLGKRRGDLRVRNSERDLMVPFVTDHPDAALIAAAPSLAAEVEALRAEVERMREMNRSLFADRQAQEKRVLDAQTERWDDANALVESLQARTAALAGALEQIERQSPCVTATRARSIDRDRCLCSGCAIARTARQALRDHGGKP